MAWIGAIAFLVVFLINIYITHAFIASVLVALALAMSLLPEEIPVAFSTFTALGVRRLLKKNILSKDPLLVEALGAASVICADKTGTLTQNHMTLAAVAHYPSLRQYTPAEFSDAACSEIISYAMWASEPDPFDPMEKAIHLAYAQCINKDERSLATFVHEYPLSGSPPAMTHVFRIKKHLVVASKGGIETIMAFSHLSHAQQGQVLALAGKLASEGFRVLGVAAAEHDHSPFPTNQADFNWTFKGLIALYDPPKPGIREVITAFYNAGVDIKVVSGDFAETTLAVALQSGIALRGKVIAGNEIMQATEAEVSLLARENSIFARMYPEAKLKLINALKTNGETVAMTGDGVNDGPALKAAHIGIAMGKKGTEIARRAASIILLDDDLSGMVTAIAAGRNIYNNLKKAIRYIVSIHVVIILAVLVPLLAGWPLINIFSPVHIIFFELIMGPTCSIIYENEPVEKDTMKARPRNAASAFISSKELLFSILQGGIISIAVLSLYYWYMQQQASDILVRSVVFVTIIAANILLTLVNRSFSKPLWVTLTYKNNLVAYGIGITILLTVIVFAIAPIRHLFMLQALTAWQLVLCIAAALLAVLWVEVLKVSQQGLEA
jgi:P-type Ca2+ transporter type 2C